MQISNVMLSDLNPEMRIDAEYYRAEILNRINILDKKNNVTLDKLVDFVVGPFGSTVTVDKYVDESDFRYVRNKDINDFVIANNESALIPESVYSSLRQFQIREYDILLTVVGTLGKAAIALKNDTKSIFSCKSTLLRTKSIDPYYLITYLNSSTGQLFILRGKRGAIQEGLNLFDLKEIKVFLPIENFQISIGNIVKNSFSFSEKSQYLYDNAQTLLLTELGLFDWKSKHCLSFIKNYSDTQQAGRFDAEYFQPKYDDIVAAIKTYKVGWDTAENMLNFKDSNFSPKHNFEYKYIELANIGSNGEIIGFTEAEGQDLPTRARRKVGKDDVIVSSIEGSLSSCALIPDEYDRALCSTGFYIVDSNKINPQTLLVLLKSPIGQEQLKKGCSGTILTAINKDEIGKIVLPIVESGIQQQIKQKIIESFNLRKQSKHLLECAKKAVEMAIEKDEETAMQWLDSQLDGIGMRN